MSSAAAPCRQRTGGRDAWGRLHCVSPEPHVPIGGGPDADVGDDYPLERRLVGSYRWQLGRPWECVGHGVTGGQYSVLSLALSSGAHPALLAGTAVGVLRYTGVP